MVPCARRLNEDTHKDDAGGILSPSTENEQEESEEEELQVPRELEEVLAEDVVPSKIKDV